MNREKIDLTSVIGVLILGEKGARSFEREIEILGKIKGRGVERILKFWRFWRLKTYQMSSKCLMS